MSMEDQHRDWNALARLDPFWAVLSHPDKKFGRWDLDEFLASGRGDVERILATGERYGVPQRWETALDFGCGLGRLAPHLAPHFTLYLGVDISEEMVERARGFHQELHGCRFSADPSTLDDVADGHFDLVVSLYVLQHVRTAALVLDQLTTLVRVLRPGGLLAVQLPASVPVAVQARHRVRRAAYTRLRSAGVSEAVLYQRLRLSPMTMTPMAQSRVTGHLMSQGARVLTVEHGRMGRRTANRVYFATKDPTA
jgi:SAM-dependent methyltransferase